MGFPQKTKSMRFYHSFGVEYNHDGGEYALLVDRNILFFVCKMPIYPIVFSLSILISVDVTIA